MDKKGKILIIDDNEDVLFALQALLASYVEKIITDTNPEAIKHYMETVQPDVILLDMNFEKDVSSGSEGFFWLGQILETDPGAIVVLMTAYADMDKAIQAIKSGAADFISKPWEKDKLLATINTSLRLKESQKKLSALQNQVHALNVKTGSEIIGNSAPMRQMFDMIERLADTEANVLILGENGTGKDLVARTVHDNSLRKNKIFVGIDLGSISESLFESELFGYEKGAFTDAKKEKPGRMEVASGGTLFLDEIANLSLPMQAKMLTAIEKKKISRLGSTKDIPIDVRLICATNTDIRKAVEEGIFRQDLFYRINTIEIYIPPLREREGDVILLAEYFLKKYSIKYKKDIAGLSLEVKRKLSNYHWPGNVRELQSIVERAVILASGKKLNTENFVLSIRNGDKIKDEITLNLESIEKNTIEKAIELSEGNLNKAAELLGISRFSLYRKINKKK